MDLRIDNRVALVTAAGSGLGQAMALSLAKEGVKVAVTGRSVEKLNNTVALIKEQGGEAHAWVLDLSQPDTFDNTLDAIREKWGNIDILINNSGGPTPSKAEGVSADVWQTQFNTMVCSLIQLTDKVLPAMKSNGWGRIITSTSSGVIAPIPNLAISNTLRMSLLGWSKTLSSEVAADGITVNVILPGRIATERVAQIDAITASKTGCTVEEITEKSLLTIPMKRYGDPEEYGATAAFLASEQASYITGSVIRVDGGLIPSTL